MEVLEVVTGQVVDSMVVVAEDFVVAAAEVVVAQVASWGKEEQVGAAEPEEVQQRPQRCPGRCHCRPS